MGKVILLLAIAAVLAGCATTTVVVPPCDGWAPIHPARGETPRLSGQLKGQILSHNLHGAETCGWVPPQKATTK